MSVSIIIPCYNVSRYLDRCLQSALNQTYQDCQIIAVDNNSTDGSIDILREYQAKFPNKILVCEEKRQGAPWARNLGLSKSKAVWIQFLDADDHLQPGKIATQIQEARTTDIDVIIGSYNYHLLDGSKKTHYPDDTDPFQSLFETRLGNTVANLWKKEILEQVGGWNVNLPCHQEYDLLFRLVKEGANFCFSDAPLAEIHLRSAGQISSKNYFELAKTRVDLFLHWIDWIKSHKSDWYTTHHHFTNFHLFIALDHLGTHDAHLAEEIFKQKLPSRYRPGIINILKYRKYHHLTNYVLGFRKYLMLKHFLRTKLKSN